jgi:hypothetical protein
MKRSLPTFLILLSAILITALILPTPALADGGEGGLTYTQTINGYTVHLVFQKPAFVGENPIHIQILDAAGMPITGADVEVSLEEAESADHEEAAPSAETGMSGMEASPTAMPTSAPEAMSGMNSGADPTPTPASMSSINSMSPVASEHDQMGMVALEPGHKDGEYEGELAIESEGELVVRAHITIQGELMEVDFPLHVAKSKTGAIVLASFFGLNAMIIAAAVVMKSKTVSVKKA